MYARYDPKSGSLTVVFPFCEVESIITIMQHLIQEEKTKERCLFLPDLDDETLDELRKQTGDKINIIIPPEAIEFGYLLLEEIKKNSSPDSDLQDLKMILDALRPMRFQSLSLH